MVAGAVDGRREAHAHRPHAAIGEREHGALGGGARAHLIVGVVSLGGDRARLAADHSLSRCEVRGRRQSGAGGLLAGDVFHGAYVFSYLNKPGKGWQDHFEFARAASTYKIQRLGNEAGLPTLADIESVKQEFQIGRKKEFWD